MRNNVKTQMIDPRDNISYGNLSREEITTFLGSRETPVCVESIGISHPNPAYFIERKHNDYYVFEYVLSGVGHIVNDNKSYTVRGGDLYILEKGLQHKYWSDRRDPYEKIWINFFGDIFGDILRVYGLSGVTVFRNCGCGQYFTELLQIGRTNIFNDEVCYDVACILFRVINTLAENRQRGKPVSMIAKQTKIRLDGALYDDITVDMIASELVISKAQLIREFKKYYDDTPYGYYLGRKIDVAKKLLATTKMRVGEIAEALSFCDPHYFSNIFKKKTGKSPDAYRKNPQ